jgi:hypothetical protein
MEVSAWSNGSGTYGIKIRKVNRQKFFNPLWQWVEVEIDEKPYKFQLIPGFWHDYPEFRDSGATVIKNWLRCNYRLPGEKGKHPRFTLEVVANKRFRLESKSGYMVT